MTLFTYNDPSVISTACEQMVSANTVKTALGAPYGAGSLTGAKPLEGVLHLTGLVLTVPDTFYPWLVTI